MTGFDALIASYILQLNNTIVGQTDPDSVDTAAVGDIGIVLGNLLKFFINNINAFVIYCDTPNPADILGKENDIYVQTNGGTSLVIWRKDVTSWAIQAIIPLGIVYEDGIIIGLRTQIDTSVNAVSASKGNWAINNVIYSKNAPTYLNYDAANIGADRIDSIYATTEGTVLYLAGAPGAIPLKPNLPANTIEVDSIYVPAEGTGTPYLFSAGTGLPSEGIQQINSFPEALQPDGDQFYLPITVPPGKTLAGAIYTTTAGVRTWPAGLQLTEDGNAITGFLNNTMDVITHKFI